MRDHNHGTALVPLPLAEYALVIDSPYITKSLVAIWHGGNACVRSTRARVWHALIVTACVPSAALCPSMRQWVVRLIPLCVLCRDCPNSEYVKGWHLEPRWAMASLNSPPTSFNDMRYICCSVSYIRIWLWPRVCRPGK
jgi:hypothetical protein